MSNAPILNVSERFISRQGEGLLTGTESYFLRLSGCNLRCEFCDTPYASWEPEKRPVPLQEVIQECLASSVHHVVLTGGEPMLPMHVIPLTQQLTAGGKHITIETAGTIDRDVACDLMSISPKLSNSDPRESGRWQTMHRKRRWNPKLIARLMERSPQFQLKFVMEREADTEEVMQAIREIQGESSRFQPQHVWLMPQATDVTRLDNVREWLEPWCTHHGFQYCDRAHLRWYGNQRGT